jgi:hypothetical protein
MLKTLKRTVKSSIQAIGLDLHRLSPSQNPFFQLRQGLEKFSVDLVFDKVLASGQFKKALQTHEMVVPFRLMPYSSD